LRLKGRHLFFTILFFEHLFYHSFVGLLDSCQVKVLVDSDLLESFTLRTRLLPRSLL
jgi:hypothetical protein